MVTRLKLKRTTIRNRQPFNKRRYSRATAIIVAADKQVEMARFGRCKSVIITKVADGINKADELQHVLRKADATYHAGEDAGATDESVEGESLGRQFYKHLMNGVLPFAVVGGILIAVFILSRWNYFL